MHGRPAKLLLQGVLDTTAKEEGRNAWQKFKHGLSEAGHAIKKGFDAAGHWIKKEADNFGDELKNFAEGALLDLASKLVCRVIVPGVMGMVEVAEDAVPVAGEVADAAEIAATPAIIKSCSKLMDKGVRSNCPQFNTVFALILNATIGEQAQR